MKFSLLLQKMKIMNTNTFPTKSMIQHQKMPNVSIPQPRYYTASEFRQFCKDDLTRLLKKHGRI